VHAAHKATMVSSTAQTDGWEDAKEAHDLHKLLQEHEIDAGL
jgi:hypothetical protein